jgi:glycine/D-amino acid oxidase-like deaminating enzyme
MWFSLPNMRRRWGDEGALGVARAARDAIDGVESFCREQGVDAWFRRGGYLQVSAAPAQDGAWEEAVAACRALGAIDSARTLTPDQVATRCASPAFRAGAFYPDAATVQPARLALGLRARLLSAGVEIHEHSVVRRLRGSPAGVEASTDSGSVRAGAAIVAIGAAAKSPRGPLRNTLTVTSSHIVLTEPVPDLLEEIGWTGGECITDCRTMLHYFRTTPGGRIAFGLGGGRIAFGGRLRGRV